MRAFDCGLRSDDGQSEKYCSSESLAPTEQTDFQFNKKGGVQIRTPPEIKNGST